MSRLTVLMRKKVLQASQHKENKVGGSKTEQRVQNMPRMHDIDPLLARVVRRGAFGMRPEKLRRVKEGLYR